MYFGDLYRKLIDLAKQRVRAGEVSERGLARQCQISQPHLHNAFKNIRILSPDAADRLMRSLNLTVPDLLWLRPEDGGGGLKSIPMLRNRIGPGSDADLDVHRGYFPAPASMTEGIVDPVAARLGAEFVLPRLVEGNDIALLDRNPAVRERARGGGCWVVAEPAGLRVRYVRLRDGLPCVANEATLPHPENWLPVSAAGGNILDIVRARIVWISREMEKEPAGPLGPTGESD
jgi:hypothetical protein